MYEADLVKPLEKFANKSIKAAGLANTKGKPLKPKDEKMGINTKAHNTDKSFIAETTTVSSAEQLAGGTTPLQDVIKAQTLSNATASRSSQTSEIGSKTLKIARKRQLAEIGSKPPKSYKIAEIRRKRS